MTKKTRIRIGIVIVIVSVVCFFDLSLAAEQALSDYDLKIMGKTVRLDTIVSALAWFWIYFAKLAGTFLTNKWVYGEIFSLDTLLWRFRNIAKNVANFGLGFYFVYIIVKGLVGQGKQDITKNLKDIILWLLVAGIGIQASWFLTAVTLDISTVTLVAAGSLPSQIISENIQTSESIKQSLTGYIDEQGNVTTGKVITLFSTEAGVSDMFKVETFSVSPSQPYTGLLDDLMPNQNDVSGPLYFLGFSILKADSIPSMAANNETSIKATIANLIIQGGTTIVFAIEMFVLCILALMRIVYLRMFIILSPLAILIWCIEKTGEKLSGSGGKKFLSKFTEQINFTSFFINVFKPTLIVLGISIAVIFASLMNNLVQKSMSNTSYVGYKGTRFSSTMNAPSGTNNPGDQTYTTTLDGDFVHVTLANAGKTILGFILSVIVVIMLYMIIKIAVKMGGKSKDFVTDRISKIQEGVGNVMGSLPVMPVQSYDKDGVPKTRFLSASQLFDVSTGRSQLLDEVVDKYSREVSDKTREQNAVITQWFNKKGYLSGDEQKRIEQAGQDKHGLDILTAKFNAIPKVDNVEEGKDVTLRGDSESSKFWVKQFENWLEKVSMKELEGKKEWTDMAMRWKDENNKKKGLAGLFDSSHSNRVRAYAEHFGLEGITKWSDLIDADLSVATGSTSKDRK